MRSFKIVGLLLIVLIPLLLGCKSQRIDAPLVALKNVDGIQGSFFLASGSIGTKEYYFFMYQISDGGLRRGKVSASTSVIYETDGAPHARGKVLYDSNSNDWQRAYDPVFYEMEFFIPPGSIARDFRVD